MDPIKQAAATMVAVLEPMFVEYTETKASLDTLTGKRDEIRAENLAKVQEETDDETVNGFCSELFDRIENSFGTEASAEYVLLSENLKGILETVNSLSESYLDGLTGALLAKTGNAETLKKQAIEIRAKYENLASSAKQLDPDVEIKELPALSRKGRPKGSGKHQVNSATFTIYVDDVKQATTKVSSILLQHSTKCGGEGTNGTLSMSEFAKLLPEGYSNEYAGNWEITLPNNKVIRGERIETVSETEDPATD